MIELTKKEFDSSIQEMFEYTVRQLETLGFLNIPSTTVIDSYKIKVKHHTWWDMLLDREIPKVLISIEAEDK